MTLEPNYMPESGEASQTPRSISPPVLPSHGCVGDAMAPCRPSQPTPAGPPQSRRVSRRCKSKEVSRRLLNFVSLSHHKCYGQAPVGWGRHRCGRGEGEVVWATLLVVGGTQAHRHERGRWRRRARKKRKLCLTGGSWDPQLRMVLVAKHPNLSMVFWSGVNSTELRAISNTPNTSKK
jgi:hypothetical protein